MTASLWCAESVSMTRVYEDVVVLDVAQDRYECLVDAASWLDPQPDGGLRVQDELLADQMIEAGLASLEPPSARETLPPPDRALAPGAPANRLAIIRAGLVLAAATATFHNRRFADLTKPRRESPPAAAVADEDTVQAVVAAARAAAPFIPFEGECLHRAYVLRRLLEHQGIGANWVFGVRTWPFAAHCWLQIGSLVVGDTLDRVRHYSPIRIV